MPLHVSDVQRLCQHIQSTPIVCLQLMPSVKFEEVFSDLKCCRHVAEGLVRDIKLAEQRLRDAWKAPLP